MPSCVAGMAPVADAKTVEAIEMVRALNPLQPHPSSGVMSHHPSAPLACPHATRGSSAADPRARLAFRTSASQVRSCVMPAPLPAPPGPPHRPPPCLPHRPSARAKASRSRATGSSRLKWRRQLPSLRLSLQFGAGRDAAAALSHASRSAGGAAAGRTRCRTRCRAAAGRACYGDRNASHSVGQPGAAAEVRQHSVGVIK